MRAKEILGRDLRPEESTMTAVAAVLNQKDVAIIGTCACIPIPEESTWKARWFCSVRNFLFRISLIKGSNGILFTNRKVFEEIGGYDEDKSTFEHIDLVRRALAHGSKWIYLQDVYVQISMRRYEHNGYLKTLFWWSIEALRYKLGLKSRKWVEAGILKKKKRGG
jgi:hypothetical protein